MKGSGGQTPQAEQTNATDMISRQTRDDTNRLGGVQARRGPYRRSTPGRKIAAANDTSVAGRRYMEHLYSPSTGAVAVPSKDDNTHLAAVCHRDVKLYQCAKPVDQWRRTIWHGVLASHRPFQLCEKKAFIVGGFIKPRSIHLLFDKIFTQLNANQSANRFGRRVFS